MRGRGKGASVWTLKCLGIRCWWNPWKALKGLVSLLSREELAYHMGQSYSDLKAQSCHTTSIVLIGLPCA